MSIWPKTCAIIQRRRLLGGAMALLLLACCTAALRLRAAAALDTERGLIERGQYKDAISQLDKAVAQAPANAEAMALLLQARLETGDYRKAFEQGQEFLKRSTNTPVAERAAEAALQLGEYERAAALLEKITTPHAERLRGSIADHKGDKEAARAAYERAAAVITRPVRISSEDRGAAAAALAELGRFKEANQAYSDAVKNDPKNAELKTAWGELLAAKHNPADAQGLFQEAIDSNPSNARALAGMAELSADRWEGKAVEWIQRALEVNPNLADAHLLRAHNALEEDEFKAAEEQINEVLKTNPRSLEAMSLRAVYEYLQAYLGGNNAPPDPPSLAVTLKENPHYGRVFAELGDFCFLKRELPESIAFYRRALALDPTLDDARSRLGINLFRNGEEQEGRKVLEDAYGKDPYNVWTVNTLRLMDSFTKFDNYQTPHFAVKLQKKESEILKPYVTELLERSINDLTKRYGQGPPQTVTFEMYPDHEDFAVRTLGLPGLGALGATLGNVVAMDSPSARPVGAFHWGSTLWHELAHVISIAMTAGRVPRWFTEGLSVYEETRARSGWGDPMELETVKALQSGKLLPLEKLNAAFVRPQYPGQIQFAYYQGGLICQYIADKFGFDKILAILRGYRQGRSDVQVIQDALGQTVAEFDAGFLKYAREQTYGFAENLDWQWAPPIHKVEEYQAEIEKNPRNYFAHLRLAAMLAKQSKWEDAVREAQTAQELFPDYVGGDSPYRVMADSYESMGQMQKAAAELGLWKQRKGRDPEAFKKLATLQKELGRTDDAITTLEDALHVSMFDQEIHNRLGDWYLERSKVEAAVREYRALLTLNPADKASAHYSLASAYRALSDDQNARAEVLAALEIAPGFRPAQKLLLELTGK